MASPRGLRRAIERAVGASIANIHLPHGWPTYALFWGVIGIWFSFALAVLVEAMTGQLRPLLWFSLPFGAFGIWLLLRKRKLWCIAAIALLSAVTWVFYAAMAPEPTWVWLFPSNTGNLMILFPVHEGPAILDHVLISIIDQERTQVMTSKGGRGELIDGSEIDAMHRDVSYPEIDSVNRVTPIFWQLLSESSARLSVGIKARGEAFSEDIGMHKTDKGFAYLIEVRDRHGIKLLSCSDDGSNDRPCSVAPRTTLLRRVRRLLRIRFLE